MVNSLLDLDYIKNNSLRKILPENAMISVGMGTCGIGNGAEEIYNLLSETIGKQSLAISIKKVGCFGFCANEPLVNLYIKNKPILIMHGIKIEDISMLVNYCTSGILPDKKILCKIESWDHLTGYISYGHDYEDIPNWNDIDFYKGQTKLVLRDCGLINPEDIEEYIAVGGYYALEKVLTNNNPDEVINTIKKSKLRGRGGAGFPTGTKWELMKKEKAEKKYIICNADEGDPGAYMNRNEIEGDPHMLIEGMIIAAFSMGATEGIIYMRAEYPLAVERISKAIQDANIYGLLGNNIFNSGFSFSINVVEGAGAFVCGEETALIASIEGKSGRPIPRPPFPAQRGLYGYPTNINNVETLSNVAVILSKGAEWFSGIGTDKSSGTKVFSLVGKIKNTGLVELPMGSLLSDIVYGIGGSTGTNKKIKAVQTGGPSGGCIPTSLFNTPVDYESLASIGAIMGSGGMVVMDTDNCMVDVARYFLEFNTSESCGKCVPCREGLVQLLFILKRITKGQGKIEDIEVLKSLSSVIKDSALCGLGQTGPNPVITTLKYFYNEYEEHIKNQYCQAGVCQELILSPCINSCPLHMNIPGYMELYKEGKLEEAFELILRDNPLPASTGRICHFHCKTRCRREDVDVAVMQGEIHRFISDSVYKENQEEKAYQLLIAEKLPSTGKKIAIIGAGPSGLTAAYYLARLGHEVTVFEKHVHCGGIPYYGIPAYRLPKNILEHEINFIKRLGVNFSMGTEIKAEDISNLTTLFDKVIVAIGAYKPMEINIDGEACNGVYQGTHFLESFAEGKPIFLGNKTIVIGGGNVAIDVARTATRLGTKATIVYRRDQESMPANEREIAAAIEEGITFNYFSSPLHINHINNNVTGLTVAKMQPGNWDTSGRRKPTQTEEIETINCDSIMIAIGERVDNNFTTKANIKMKNETIEVDIKSFKTNIKVQAIGDCVLGPATAAEAMAQGKKVAEQIDIELVPINKKDTPRWQRLSRNFLYPAVIPLEPIGVIAEIEELEVGDRNNNFNEVSLGIKPSFVFNETLRCMRCDVKETGSKL